MIVLPPSKSIGARYLVSTYFAGTLPADPVFEENDDLMVLQEALLEVYSDEEPIDYGDSPIDVGASGTALRFVTAVCASSPGADYVITGTPRLMQRPMDPLIDVLKAAGAEIECLGENGAGPYRVKGGKLKGGEFSIRGDISSQFISALMLVAPSWEKGLKLFFTTGLVSRPYIVMTMRLLQQFGVKVNLAEDYVEVAPGSYIEPHGFTVESDWSSASFFYEAAAIGVKKIEIGGLCPPAESLQGDSSIADIFRQLGVVSSFDKEGAILDQEASAALPETIDIDFIDMPDLVLPVALACLCKEIKFRFKGTGHLRLKESDRVASLLQESLKLGYKLEEGNDYICWDGEKMTAEQDPLIDTFDDHRVAMSFAMVALKTGKIRISHPEVVEKSYIDFWNQLPKIGLEVEFGKDEVLVYSKI